MKYRLRFLLVAFLCGCSFALSAQVTDIRYGGPFYFSSVDSVQPLVLPTNLGGSVNPFLLVRKWAGSGKTGLSDGKGEAVSFNGPSAMCVDSAGTVYVCDSYNGKVRKISSDGIVSTLSNTFNFPYGLAVDATGNLYVSEVFANRIQKVTPSDQMSIFAGSTAGISGYRDSIGTAARLNGPHGLTFDKHGNLFVADSYNNRIRKITPEGVVTTVAGNGKTDSTDALALQAGFCQPSAIAIDSTGTILVADTYNYRIRKIDLDGMVSTVCGHGDYLYPDTSDVSTQVGFSEGILFDGAGRLLFLDSSGSFVRQMDANWVHHDFARNAVWGTSCGRLDSSYLLSPTGIAVDANQVVYVSDGIKNQILRMEQANYYLRTPLPEGFQFDLQTGRLSGSPLSGCAPMKLEVITKNESGLGRATLDFAVKGKPTVETQTCTFATDSSAIMGCRLVNAGYPQTSDFGICWNTTGSPTMEDVHANIDPKAIADSNTLVMSGLKPTTTYYVRAYAKNEYGTSYGAVKTLRTVEVKPQIRYGNASDYEFKVGQVVETMTPLNQGGEVAIFDHFVSTLAGTGVAGFLDGPAPLALFKKPYGLAFDAFGTLFVTEASPRIRKISSDGIVSTYAGNSVFGLADGTQFNATFKTPYLVAFDTLHQMFVVDQYGHNVRKMDQSGYVSTFAGNGTAGSTNGLGTAARFNNPTSIAVNRDGVVFVADCFNNKIRKITPDGQVTTYAGTGVQGYKDGPAANAVFHTPMGICLDGQGNLLIAENGGCRIRKIDLNQQVTTVSGSGTRGMLDGVASKAMFNYMTAIAVDSKGYAYVADANNANVRKIAPDGSVTTIAGNPGMGQVDGFSNVAKFYFPMGIAVDSMDNVYVADQYNYKIRKITPVRYTIEPPLPAGFSFDFQTGKITGTPLMACPLTEYTITVKNTGGTNTTKLNLSVSSSDGLHPFSSISPVLIRSSDHQFCIGGLPNATTVSVYTMAGIKVMESVVAAFEPISIATLTPGLYLVHVSGNVLKLIR